MEVMVACKIFSRGGQWGGLQEGSPPAWLRGSFRVVVWGKAPEADIFSK